MGLCLHWHPRDRNLIRWKFYAFRTGALLHYTSWQWVLMLCLLTSEGSWLLPRMLFGSDPPRIKYTGLAEKMERYSTSPCPAKKDICCKWSYPQTRMFGLPRVQIGPVV